MTEPTLPSILTPDTTPEGRKARVQRANRALVKSFKPTPVQRERMLRWIERLERNEDRQVEGALRNDRQNAQMSSPGFCCLGLACDVMDPTQWMGEDTDDKRYLGVESYLPHDVMAFFGLPSADPPLTGVIKKFTQHNAVTYYEGETATLDASVWNDAQGATFPEIAAMLRATYGFAPKENK